MPRHPELSRSSADHFCQAALDALAAGIDDPGHALHTLALATTGREGAPRLRSVVPRDLNAAARRISIHTDIRSAKIAELRRDPRAALLGYDGGARLQIRLEGRCAIHHADAVARQGWDRARPGSKRVYRIAPRPGAAVASEEGIEPEHFDEAAAFGNFALLAFTFETMDILFLGKARHRRLRAGWTSGGPPPGSPELWPELTWLVP